MRDSDRPAILRYLVAVVAVAAAVGARLLLDPVLAFRFPFATLFFAVLFVAWFGGFGPATVATLLGVVASVWFIMPPRHVLYVEGLENQAGLVLYLTVGLGIAVIGGAMRRAQRGAQQTAREMAAQREHLRVTLESIGDGVIATDTDGRVTSMNTVAADLTGWTPSEALGRPLDEVFRIVHEQTRESVTNPVRRVLADGRVVGLANHTALIARDGTERPIDDGAAPILDRDGRTAGVVLVFRDVTERRRIEARERMLAAVVEHCNDFIGICSTDMVPIYVNDAGRRMVGLESVEAALRTPLLEFFVPEDRARIEREALPELRRTGRWRGEVRFRHFGSGEPVHTLWNVAAIRNEAGEPIAWATVSPNLNALKAAEHALQESRALLEQKAASLRELHELGRRLMTTSDLRQALDDVLRAAVALLEADKGTVQLIDPDSGDLEIVAQRGFAPGFVERLGRRKLGERTASDRALRSGERVIIGDVETDDAYEPFRAIARTEGYRAVQSTPLVGRSGRPVGVLSAHFREPHRPTDRQLRLLDLHARLAAEFIERHRGEQALRESEARFRTLADNIAQLAWMADGQGRVFWYNQRWFDYTGLSNEAMQSWGWRAVHHPDHVANVLGKLAHCFESGEIWEDTFPLRASDGSYRWFLSRAVPIRNEAGRVRRWFGTHTDVTAEREAEQVLREADRRKDEFLATLAHELRNPLAPVRSSLEVMRRANGDLALIEQARATIDRQMSHLERLVDDLLDTSRISRDNLELRKHSTELAPVLQQALETCRPLADPLGHEIVLDLPKTPIYLDADPVRLAQLFSNLLNNACKYTDPGGRISLSARRDGALAVVSVKDTGRGIPPDMLHRIFEMFTQADRSPDLARDGLGIGLTLVRRLVEMHGGSVEARSEGVGRGSEFIVRLPCLLEVPAPASQPPVPGDAQPCRVLVVDDNRDAAESLAMLLRMTGHTAHLAHDGLEAVEVAEAVRPDVVLLDLGLPKLSGHEAARRIREQPWAREVRLVALTGWGQADDLRKSREVGFDHHLVKPVNLAHLMDILQTPPTVTDRPH